jgi:hypothetical protein
MSRTRFRRITQAAVALLLGAATATVTAGAGSAAVATGQRYFVDCTAGKDTNSGTDAQHPWRTLAGAGAVTLAPGDVLALRNGTTCPGQLAPHGSGTVDNPVVLTSYGTGAPARIDGQGARAAIFLHNVRGYLIRNLDVSNTGPAPTATQQRVGIYVLLEDYGTGAGYTIRNVMVHDVNGCDCRYPSPSGGIVFEAGGAITPTGFDSVTVANAVVNHVDRSGIGFFSSWQKRAVNPTGTGSTFVPLTSVFVHDNQLGDIGGDGIVVLNGDHARVERNSVDGFNVRSTDYNVGIYAYNSDYTRFDSNQVLNGKVVGIAYAVEGANIGTIYQHNFSRNNAGGFLYVCADDSTSADNIVRYNISNNDGGPSPFLGLLTLPCAPQANTQVYNNVFYAPASPTLVQNFGGVQMQMTNNIFVGQPGGSTINDPYGTYDHNVFHQVTALPAHETASVQQDPQMVDPTNALAGGSAQGFALRSGSPALGFGTAVPEHGSTDYFGNPIPSGGQNIGAYEGPGI